MLSIFKKEIYTFFISPIAYIVVGVFLLLNGLFLWVFNGAFNIIDYGFADLSSFFLLAPWVLIFLIPAVTMRSFSEEKKQGTLELLLTKPIPLFHVILGKYFGAFFLVFLSLVPTLLYVFAIYRLGNPIGNIDFGSTLGSYFGLLFLAASYTAIGIFSSSLSSNQIIVFIIAVLICLFLYVGVERISFFFSNTLLEQMSLQTHYKSMSRGVIDTRDLLYFLSVTLFFWVLTRFSLSK